MSFHLQLSIVAASVGTVEVAELDWGNKDHIRSVCPPFDYIIATDVVSYL